ncbi:MAG: hypothetical protein HN353_07425 [Bdellovibrionales bacterium]|jgi:predicted DNA binding CopG/RHH family protein|nr:hypothetical protein [Bdellovibrionales bacterium]MBT3526641.1 hypothetical protein [Bdellovibrionales bacterium]MBT7667993.1 hypothetical protein [Bdellovibrionales bacterium]MBT7766248.1 hypothetical protein [Bdellovibrionales bacterium]
MDRLRKYARKQGYEVDEKMTLEFQRQLRLSKKKAVTIRLPEEVIEEYKKLAGDEGKYQAIMREILIEALSKKAS